MLGHYEIKEKLGEGGMGVVFRARDTKLERDVALKLLQNASSDPQSREKLLAEARSASALNHPNVATIYEVGEHEGQTFIVMELVPGLPLSKSIPPGGLPIETCLRYGAQIAAALAQAHERHIIHRDLKSANVVVTPDGQAKVLDFGLARSALHYDLDQITRSRDSLATSDTIAGTLHSMAPELLRGSPADSRSDIWALGVILYEMASGGLPFQGRTGFELTSATLQASPAPLPERVPSGMRVVIQHCLAKEPGHRYSSASQVHAALEAISSDSAVPLERIAFPAPRPLWRSKWVWLAAALVAFALFSFIVWERTFFVPAGVRENSLPSSRLTTGGRSSPNAEANDIFERSMLSLKSRLDIPNANLLLRHALELDPKFPSARAYYGFTELQMIYQGLSNDRGLLYQAEENIRQAREEEPDLSVAAGFLSGVYLFQGRTDLAFHEAQESIRLSSQSGDPSGTIWLAHCYYLSGNYKAAMNELQSIMRTAPLFWPAHWFAGQILLEQGQLDSANEETQKVLDQDPLNLLAITTLSYGQLTVGDPSGARAQLEKASPEAKDNFRLRLAWALVNASDGKATGDLDPEVLKFADANPLVTLSVAEFYALRGDSANSLNWLDRAVRNGDERLEWFRRDPLLANIRNQPRFSQILEAIASRRKDRVQ